MHELQKRGHSRTNFTPEEIADAYRNAENAHERGEVRELLRSIDDGRFYEMLDASHNVLARSDLKRREHFVENHNEHLIKWIQVFGLVEDLNRFQDINVE